MNLLHRLGPPQVWLDIEMMKGSTIESMADAVECAAAVCYCISSGYKESTSERSTTTVVHAFTILLGYYSCLCTCVCCGWWNLARCAPVSGTDCRMEAQYAHQQQKDVSVHKDRYFRHSALSARATADPLTMRVQFIRHFKSCMTNISIYFVRAYVGLSSSAPAQSGVYCHMHVADGAADGGGGLPGKRYLPANSPARQLDLTIQFYPSLLSVPHPIYYVAGWLGMLLGVRLWYAFYGAALESDSAFAAKLEELCRELGERGHQA
eukprot:COSAG05_NODE_965_length_6403_cov_50.682741_7_plen_265_part_00